MDVLVEWRNGKRNIVASNELLAVKKGQTLKKDVGVKMYYSKRWYYDGIETENQPHVVENKKKKNNKRYSRPDCNVDATEQTVSSDKNSDSDIPLARLLKKSETLVERSEETEKGAPNLKNKGKDFCCLFP
ncbi:unnamed protein product [Acanthoscelides obtectus]|uniref:Uncharacterized protein n=1 Tax=Acanthoscelides obtectus TaxID=200917 RepID=A0A9P0MA51_ACAOB|nr:unnamed protein product [Acanthoscelides obtectus]CAK1680475.1 hypothetical protein AOBTE_LOCUS32684 [Acanthoscelides obtectus]